MKERKLNEIVEEFSYRIKPGTSVRIFLKRNFYFEDSKVDEIKWPHPDIVLRKIDIKLGKKECSKTSLDGKLTDVNNYNKKDPLLRFETKEKKVIYISCSQIGDYFY